LYGFRFPVDFQSVDAVRVFSLIFENMTHSHRTGNFVGISGVPFDPGDDPLT
jgi:hypothetical protein